jgi:hypothetical protein
LQVTASLIARHIYPLINLFDIAFLEIFYVRALWDELFLFYIKWEKEGKKLIDFGVVYK